MLHIEYNKSSIAADYEAHYDLYRTLGVSLVVCAVNGTYTDEEQSACPHVVFAAYSNGDFWKLQRARGYTEGTAQYLTDMFIRKGGRIDAWSNGESLGLANCARWMARDYAYAARVPADLAALEAEAFAGAKLASVDLANGQLRRIGSRAFANAGALRVVRIPETVASIADDAFAGCGSLIVVCTTGTAGYRYAVGKGYEVICE